MTYKHLLDLVKKINTTREDKVIIEKWKWNQLPTEYKKDKYNQMVFIKKLQRL